MKKLKLKSSSIYWLYLVIVFSVQIFFLDINKAHATTFIFDPAQKVIGVGGEFKIDLFVEVNDEKINVVGGVLKYPESLIEVVDLSIGNSIISLWIENPEDVGGKVVFSGVIPGGFDGVLGPFDDNIKPGKLFSILFKTKHSGLGDIRLEDIQVLLNDGKGSFAEISTAPFFVKVLDYKDSSTVSSKGDLKDIEPPENFILEIGRDPIIFNNKYFISFGAIDKGSGIDRYEIFEAKIHNIFKSKGAIGNWVVAESPYVLKDQSFQSVVKVKAIDKAGNERIVGLSEEELIFFQEDKKFMFVVVVLIFIVYIIRIVIKKYNNGSRKK